MLPLHHRFVERSGRPGSNGPLRAGNPVLFRLSYIRKKESALPRSGDGGNARLVAQRDQAAALGTHPSKKGRSGGRRSDAPAGRETGDDAVLPDVVRDLQPLPWLVRDALLVR